MLIYDIKDLYVNIPIKETLDITKLQLSKKNDIQTTKQIINLLDIILKQNYFSFQNKIYQPEKRSTYGIPHFSYNSRNILTIHRKCVYKTTP